MAAELLLFVLVGAAVDFRMLKEAGVGAVCLLLLGWMRRMVGVEICLVGTGLTGKERLFTAVAYLPKATVQAAIGAIPLTQGLAGGAEKGSARGTSRPLNP